MFTQRFRLNKTLWFWIGIVLFFMALGAAAPLPALAAKVAVTGPGGVGATDGYSALRLWFKTDAGVYADFDCTTLANTGGLVACWADQSGHGEMVRQSDAGYQPLYITTSRLKFDTAILSSTQSLPLFAEANAGLSAIVVFNTTSYTETGVVVNHGASNGADSDENFELGYTVGNTNQSGNFGLHRGGGDATVAPQGTIADESLTLMSTLVLTSGTAPDNLAIYKNGLTMTVALNGAGWLEPGSYSTASAPLDIGGRRDGNNAAYPDVTPDAFLTGEIAEIIVYTTTLNSAQRLLVENYLAAKYGITLDSAAVKYFSSKYFNKDVAGIGREADGMHTPASSAGLQVTDSGFLQDNGDYVMVGHRSAVNAVVYSALPLGVQSRWERSWYFDFTDEGTSGGKVTLAFDFSDAGISGSPAGIYVLLGRSSLSGRFQIIQTSSYIVGDQVIFADTPALQDEWYYTIGAADSLDYAITNNYQPGGPAYNFEDISASGVRVLSTGSNDQAIDVPINFTFNFYDQEYVTATISTNGFVALKPGQTPGSGTPPAIPNTAAPNGLVAGWWMDLNPIIADGGGGTIHYTTTGSSPGQVFIVQYTDVPRSGTTEYTSTFQIKLFESTDRIEVHYLSASTNSVAGAGIEDQEGVRGLQYYYAGAPLSHVAVRYARPKLLVDKTVNEPTPRVGERITYTVIVRSNILTPITTVVLTDTLDAGLTFDTDALAIEPAQSFDHTFDGQVLELSNFSLEAGKRVTFTIPVTVSAVAAPSVELMNRVVMTGPVLLDMGQDAIGVVPDDCWVRVGSTTYNNLQAGLDAAAPGSEVKVAGYCVDVATRNELAQVGYITKSLTLRGGYAPGGADWATTYPTRTTVLDARSGGRVLYIVPGISVTLENLHLIGGDAWQSGSSNSYGGGIYADTAQVTLNGMQIYQNLADYGGGGYVYSGTLALDDTLVFSNTADTNGGGLALDTVQQVAWDANEVFSNTAELYGGGLYFEATPVWLRGTRISGNQTLAREGGGGAYFKSSVVTVTACSVYSNTAFRGGGISIVESTAVLTDTDFFYNHSWGTGFGSNGGGGVYVEKSNVTLWNNDFIHNTSASRGAGLTLYDNTTAILQDNRFQESAASSHGAGLYGVSVNTVTLTANSFNWNVAGGMGAGAYIYGKSQIALTGNTFFSNTALSHGGGAYLRSPVLQVLDNEFEANVSGDRGGGLYLEDGVLDLERNRVWENRAAGHGGGGYFSKTSGQVLSNTWELNLSSQRGGGLYTVSSGDTTVQNNSFLTNTAASGGGANFGNGKLTVFTNTFSGNTARSSGGGVTIQSNVMGLWMRENVFQANQLTSADPGGGGLYASGSHNLILEHNQVISNISSRDGGGIYLVDVEGIVITNTLESNTATRRGSGFCVDGGTTTLVGNLVQFNGSSQYGGGGYLANPFSITVRANAILSNTAQRGGGLYMANGTSSILEDNTIAYNSATRTEEAGAGIYISAGATNRYALNHNTIQANTAAGQGGGIYASNADLATLNANSILMNTADSGSGVYLSASESLLTNNLLVGNTAAAGGNGIYVIGALPRIMHTTFVGNTGGDGSGIYVARGGFPSITNTIMVNQTVGVTATANTIATLNATLWWDTPQQSGGAGTVISDTNLVADPLFVNGAGGDYHITINSPALNAGVDSGVTTDIDADARPQAGGYDLGADEYADGCFVKLNNAEVLYTSIQDAVNVSQPADLIKVAGTCDAVETTGGTLQTAYLNKSLTIRGGYTLTDWVNPDALLYPTTLGARNLGRVVFVAGGAAVTIEGLRITGGNATAGGGNADGGGIYVNTAADLTLANVTIDDNTADNGAGVYVNNAALLLEDGLIADNTAAQDGGGLYALDGQVTLLHNTVRDNAAANGAGLYLYQTEATLRHNTLTGNNATADGGAVYLDTLTTLTFETNMVRANSADYGGGLFFYESPVTLERNRFTSNAATYGGGLFLSSGSDATLINTIIADNTASATGSGVHVQNSTPHFQHLTLARNTGGDGSGIRLTASTAWLTNTLLVSHTVGVLAEAGAAATLEATLWGSGDWANGQDSAGTVISTTNYYGDPAFINPTQPNYHIGETSDAIDKGVTIGVLLDIDGLTRGVPPDLGADEYRTCWVRINDSPTDYVLVQDAIAAGSHITDVVKIAGYCAGMTAQPRRDVSVTGVVSQIAYLTRTLTLQGGYTSTNFIAAYPLTQPATLAANGRGRVVYATGNVAPVIRGLTLTGGNAAGLGGDAGGDAGGGVYVITGTLTLSQTALVANESAYGGGLYVASGATRLYNAVIAQNNAATAGGGAYATAATLSGIHTTWAENTGSGLYLAGNSTAVLTNTILVSHTVGINAASGSAADLVATLWQNNTQDTGGAGAISTAQDYTGAPKFVAPATYDYHIRVASAAIDRGVPALAVDMDGTARAVGAAPDLGADEYPAGLRLIKQASSPVVRAGDPLTYTLWVTNTGLVGYRAYIRDILPNHVMPGGTRTWTPYLYPQEVWSRTLIVQVALDYTGWLTNTASVTTTSGLTATATALTFATMEADLMIFKEGPSSALAPGAPLAYTLTYTNAGPNLASGVVITDLLPTAIISANVTSTPPLPLVAGTQYVWEVGDLPPATGGEIVITGYLNTGLAGGAVITNEASLVGLVVDVNPANNYTATAFTVLDVPPTALDDAITTPEDTPVTVDVLANDEDWNGDALTVTALEGVAHGVATLNGALVTYTPTLNFNGTAVFTYVVTDGVYDSRAQMIITVTPANDPPTAAADTAATAEDTVVDIPVLDNDSDLDNDPLTVVSVGGEHTAIVGVLVRYTPALDFHGVESFTYTVSDGQAEATAWVTVLVTPVNDAPVAVDDEVSTPTDTPRLFAVLANDTDIDGDALMLASVGVPTSGSATVQGDQVLYTPAAGFTGQATFTYLVSDGAASDEGLVTVDVGEPNQPPTAGDDTATTPEDTPLDIAVLDNDNDPDGDPLFIAAVGSDHAAIFNTVLRYTPAANFYGSESFTYTVSDGLAEATAWVTVTVESVNDAPVAVADGYSADLNTLLEILAPGVLENDADVEDEPLTAELVEDVSNGALTFNSDGSFIYTPDTDFTGLDAFTYRAFDGTDYSGVATVTIGVATQPPAAVDDTATTAEDTSVDIPVLDNDSDPDGDPLSVVSVAGAGAVIVGDLVRYTPPSDFHGEERFTYGISDGVFVVTASVTVLVTPVNDAPVAVDDEVSTPTDTPRLFAVLANDTDIDGDALMLASVGVPTSGSAAIQGDQVLYTPAAGFTGQATFTYLVSDGAASDEGLVTVDVGVPNQPPVVADDTATTPEDTPLDIAVLDNDSDPDGDPLFIAAVGSDHAAIFNTVLRYTPAANFYGSESFTYTVSDGLAEVTAWVTVTVESVNDVPLVVADGYGTPLNTILNVPPPGVLANDSDVEGAALSAELVNDVSGGALVFRPDGSFVYTPDTDFMGQVVFTYRAYDGEDYSDIATVTIGVANHAPEAVDDAATTAEDTPVDIPVLDNDSDPDYDPLSIASVAGDRAVIMGNFIRYTPPPDFTGEDSFAYVISDGVLTDMAYVTVTVTPVNDAPVAVDDTIGTPENTARVIAVLANDIDVDGDLLTLAAVGTPTSGAASPEQDRVLYTPPAGFTGPATFTYTVSDGEFFATGRVTVTVGATNDPPVAGDDVAETPLDTPVDIAVLDNDTDPDDDPLFIAAVGGEHAAIVGSVLRYTLAAGFTGAESFTYTVSDGLFTDTAWVTVSVGIANRAPVAADDVAETPQDTPVDIAVLDNDTDPDDDPLFIAAAGGDARVGIVGTTLRYTPTAGFTGQDSFTYTVSDGQLTDTAWVTVTVTPTGGENYPPTAADATVDANEDTPATGVVSADDPDGDALTFTIATPTLYGSLSLTQSTGAWLYTPVNRMATYQDHFQVIVSDGELTATAAITLIVTADNDAPAITSTPLTSATPDVAYAYTVHATDPDEDDAVAVITATVKPAWLTLSGSGATATLSGTPSAADAGPHSVTLVARDGGGLDSTPQTFTITVAEPGEQRIFLPLVLRNTP